MKIHSRIYYRHCFALLAGSVAALSTLVALAGSSPYGSLVESDGALAFYQFEDTLVRSNINANLGSQDRRQRTVAQTSKSTSKPAVSRVPNPRVPQRDFTPAPKAFGAAQQAWKAALL
jgi:hypothetical protein